MIRAIKRNIARRNMRAAGIRQINKRDKDAKDWKSFFAVNWREYLNPSKKKRK